MTAYEELASYKDRLYELRNDLRGLFARDGDNAVVFDCGTAMKMCREMLPPDMRDLTVRLAY